MLNGILYFVFCILEVLTSYSYCVIFSGDECWMLNSNINVKYNQFYRKFIKKPCIPEVKQRQSA